MAYRPDPQVPVFYLSKKHFECIQESLREEAEENLRLALEGLVECEPDTSDRFFKMVVQVAQVLVTAPPKILGYTEYDPIQSQSGVADWMGKHGACPVGWYTNPENTSSWGKKWFWIGGGFRSSGRFPLLLSYAKTLPTMVELQEMLRERHQG